MNGPRLRSQKGPSRSRQRAKMYSSPPPPPTTTTKSPLLRTASLISLSFLLLAIFYFTWTTKFTPPPLFTSHSPRPLFYSFEVVNEFPHDPEAFTQGLVYGGNETLFESTGLHDKSSVRQVLLQTGKVEAVHQMDRTFFGEGLTLLGERLFQVMWQTKTGFIYDRYNLHKRTKFIHQMQDGWGLATDGNAIFGSDGSSTLYHLDPETLKVIKSVTVRYNGREVPSLNELEYIDGEVWANIWQTDCIARISQEDGEVLSWVFLHGLRKGLLQSGNSGIDVLNGIAWDNEKKRLFVTGKLWPKLYEIKLRPLTVLPKESIETLCPFREWKF